MYFFVYLALIINLQLSILEAATCDKTKVSIQRKSSSLSSTSSSTQIDTNKESINESMRFGNYSNFQTNNGTDADQLSGLENVERSATGANNQQQHQDDLNLLRVEYNKYKILSNLGLNVDPDKLEPALDSDLRFKLTSSKIMSENQLVRNTNMRHKRSLACDQVKSDKDACCLEKFYVNFTDIGWDKWILHPAGYNANYCRGQCDLSHARYYHSTLLSKFSNVIGLCCSPKQMEPLRLLYIDESNKVYQKSIPDMIVKACDCA